MYRTTLPTLLTCTLLGACGSGDNPFQTTTPVPDPTVNTSTVGRATQTDSNVIIVNQAARATILPETPLTISVVTGINARSAQGHAVRGVNVLAAGGVNDGIGFAGISGVSQTAAPGSSATFDGTYGVTTLAGQSSGPIRLSYTFGDQTLRNIGGPLTVEAQANGGALTGTASFGGEQGALTGGFYPLDEVAAAFNGNTMGGVIFASQ